ncbi:lysine decarboxylase/arginine decarboxylase [Methanomicrobium sp. W14]|uniref:Orn/Lys/Arg family decarboxylase n=1 Tax=Methanomicrobium sp. W14 TaxID=2817839 RepID=UPI001AE2B940|nr:Orn/Lys/Arg decarboxylase N-terminal domain-containing protein [Methanomicrobium sp. W14]MBP2134167.1 lysine decarboxylase/arginine decarboxylase [Methanomicrobium sp. W14]
MNPEEVLQVAVVDGSVNSNTPEGNAINRIIDDLSGYGILVTKFVSYEDAKAALSNLPGADCILINWNLGEGDDNRNVAGEMISAIRERNEDIPLFMIGEPTRDPPTTLTIDIIREVNEFVWVMDDTAEFLAGRITAAARRYRSGLLPPFFGELVRFSHDFEYSWHTPGHAGGTAFRKSPAGRAFFNFFGEQLFRSDLSISVGELGSLLDHSGPVGEAEKYAAKVFGADRTYFVTNGTSTSNKIVFFGRVTEGDIVLVDRNCHKSAEHSITMTHAVPVYMIPTRNRYGIIGPISPEEFSPATIKKKIEKSPLAKDCKDKKPVHAIITNSTYDGLCYQAVWVEKELGKSVDSIHFDEAWYGYARFNPLYRDRFAMRDGAKDPEGPTVFATQSTHKLLAALSQASMVHVRNGRVPVEHSRFNEAFMMNSSTSPLYTIIASCDVSSKMMDGASGRMLTQEPIEDAIRFRRMMARIKREVGTGKDWWFGMWQPDHVTDMNTGKQIEFCDASLDLLGKNPSCWVLHPGDSWHGFKGLPDDYCMLDPIKVTVLMPGVNDDGSLAEWGIPAAIVVRFLDKRGIVIEKSGDYNILFLFSMGITKGKWGTLVTELFEFKKHYDEGSPLEEVFPVLSKTYPERYGGMTLTELVKEMHDYMRSTKQGELLEKAYEKLPEQVATYADTYKKLVKGDVEQVPVSKMQDRIVATGVFPYPPGIPVLAPGEAAGKSNGPVLSYLIALQEFDKKFPGFSHDIHGVENINGEYMIYCTKE